MFTRILQSLLAFSVSVGAGARTIAGPDLFTGEKVEIAQGRLGTVVIFLSARCPCSNSHVESIKSLAAEFKDFSFVAVHSNSDEPLELSKAYFKQQNFPFAVLEDGDAALADHFKALKTPHAYLLGRDGRVVYRGGVSNSNDGPTATKQMLREALSDVAAGRPVRVAESRALGCEIQRKDSKNAW